MSKKPSKYLTSFNNVTIKSINRFILKRLKKNNGLESRIMIEINEKFKSFLIKKYDLNYTRFKNSQLFMQDFDLIDGAEANKSNYNFIKKEDFYLKLTKQKIIEYKQKSETKRMTTNTSLSIKFLRSNEIYLNQNQKDYIKKYNELKKQ